MRASYPVGQEADSRLRAGLAFRLLDEEETRERDTRFARFLLQRLADVEATGCLAEKKLAAGVLDLYTEWDQARERAGASGQDPHAAQIAAMGWALRCLAHSAWRNTPGWEPAFHPAATQPPAPGTGRHTGTRQHP
ncbi:hypothetical protein [Streptomyces sp. 4F14]|uniref:hypothetical protein n=1 Tax=Streptomyces sp. 4F14 TaxID=3394380 RepID=UPI003A84A275